MRVGRSILVLGTAALLCVAAGCGSDSSGESTTSVPAAQVSVPESTASIPAVTAPGTTTTPKKKKDKTQTTTTTSSPSGGCVIPDAFTNFKFAGLDCTAAVAVAQAWDQNGKDCNTVDNPNVPEGYKRTCSVEGFSCQAKRDIHSDSRFVTCTQGRQSVRFTWLPA